MTRIFFLLMAGLAFGCQTSTIEKRDEPHIDTFIINKIKRDSVNRQEMFNLYDNFKISRYWKSVNKKNQYIDVVIDTEPMMYVYYRKGDTSRTYRYKDFKDYGDSLSLTTKNYNVDTIIIWTLKFQDSTKGIWSIYKPQINSYKTLGVYRPLKKYE